MRRDRWAEYFSKILNLLTNLARHHNVAIIIGNGGRRLNKLKHFSKMRNIMKSTKLVKFLVITAVVFMFFTTHAMAEKYAVLVGVKEYIVESDLNFPTNDVEAFREVLLQIGYKPENVHCLVSGSNVKTLPIKSTIEITIQEVLAKAKSGDTVIVFMTGHGFDVLGHPQFCPVDARGGSLQMMLDTTVSLNGILKAFDTCEATFKLMMVDACRSGPKEAGVKPLSPLVSPSPGVMLLQSCAVGQTSIEYLPMKHGVFTYALLEGFCGKAKNNTGAVTLLSLVDFVITRTQELAFEECNHQQTPYMLGNTTNFVLVPKGVEVPPVTDSKALEKWRKEREKAIAEARKNLDAEIQSKIKEELRNADPAKEKWQEKMIENTLSMILENAVLKEKLDMVLMPCRSDEERIALIRELITVPVLAACEEYFEAWEKEKKMLAEAEEAARAEQAKNLREFNAGYEKALKSGDFSNVAALGVTQVGEPTPAGILVYHPETAQTRLVPKLAANYPDDSMTIYDGNLLTERGALPEHIQTLQEWGITARGGQFFYKDADLGTEFKIDFENAYTGANQRRGVLEVAGKYLESGVAPGEYERQDERCVGLEGYDAARYQILNCKQKNHATGKPFKIDRQLADIIFSPIGTDFGGLPLTQEHQTLALMIIHNRMFGDYELYENKQYDNQGKEKLFFNEDFRDCIAVMKHMYYNGDKGLASYPGATVKDYILEHNKLNEGKLNSGEAANNNYNGQNVYFGRLGDVILGDIANLLGPR